MIRLVWELLSLISISYTNGAGSPQYHWYENTVNNHTTGTPIPGATSSSYTPSTAVAGTTYYYCTVDLPLWMYKLFIPIQPRLLFIYPLVDLQPISSQTICVGGSAHS